jgi:hypothetical protein
MLFIETLNCNEYVALQTPRNKHQVERTPIPPPPRRADGTRVENDGISLSCLLPRRLDWANIAAPTS